MGPRDQDSKSVSDHRTFVIGVVWINDVGLVDYAILYMSSGPRRRFESLAKVIILLVQST